MAQSNFFYKISMSIIIMLITVVYTLTLNNFECYLNINNINNKNNKKKVAKHPQWCELFTEILVQIKNIKMKI